MIVCPVCEHPQPTGAECEVCGKRLAAGSAGAPAVPLMAGLEPTLHEAAPVPPPTVIRELEPTAHGPVTEVRVDPTPGVEPTRAAPVDVDVAPAPGIERTEAGIPEDARTAVPALVVCRYCRTTAMPGERICTRCGMRLPVFDAPASAEAAPEGRRCSCGAFVTRGLCPVCGARR